MTRFIATLLCTLSLPTASAVSAPLVIDSVSTLLTPVYQQWQKNSQVFAQTAKSVCDANGSLVELQNQWRQTKDSWSIISVLPFGPLVQNNIAMQVQFWPDKKNLVGFQVERLLKQNKKSIDLSLTSVALRGLSASEYILFDQAINLSKAEDKAKYCSLLASIGEYQVALSRATSTQWQTYLSDEFSAFDASSQKAELLRAQVSALEVQHKKLALVLGKKIPQPYQAEHCAQIIHWNHCIWQPRHIS